MRHFYAMVLLFFAVQVSAQKQVYIPKIFATDPALSTWSYSRSVQSENFICFWGPVVGEHPENYSDPNLRFTPAHVLDTLEKIYDKFVHEIRFGRDDSTTNLGKYKMIIVMNETWPAGGPTGWAFGGSYDDVIGAMWVHPNSVRDGAVLSHELTHSLQGQNYIDINKTGGGFRIEPTGSFWETHANFMRLQMYPQFVKEDMPRWTATRSFQYASTRHHYAAFNLLLVIQQLDSLGMVNRLWQESVANEHALMTYRRLKGWTQNQFNDFIYEYAKRDVIADYSVLGAGDIVRAERKRLQQDEPHYLWRQYTLLQRLDSAGHYTVPDYQTPQDYGYNIIPLHPTCANRTVKIKFKGHTEGAGAGWRYGFVAVKSGGKTARYSASYSAAEAEVAFSMENDETELYLVVTGAPASHTSYVWEPGFHKIKRFPYELSIQNALPEGYQPDYRAAYKTNGHVHANGGGWVSNSATVAASVYVGPKAIVRGTSNISGNVRIEDNAWVENVTASGNVVFSGNANVWGGTYSNSAKVTDNAIMSFCTVSGNVIAKENAMEWSVTLGNSVVVGGDAEIGSCSTNGVYLQTPHYNNGRSECDGKGATDVSNIDINPAVTPFTAAAMAIGEPAECVPADFVRNLALSATATTSYVSPWESLAAINDGFTPAGSGDRGHGAYGNWNNPNSFQWVQYDWPVNYVLNKTEIYWFDDNGGVRTPDTAYLQYWKDSAWVNYGAIGVQKDAFNTLLLPDISTSKIRLSMKNAAQSTGILEWRAWGAETALPASGYSLLSFAGSRVDGANALQWETAVEDTVARYELEYGTDSIHFIKINTATASGVNSYAYTHRSNSANSFYRLKQIFDSGNSRYSRVLKISTAVENLAMLATATTSYVSPWENLGAVNDGFTPANSNDKSHGAYGNWYSPDSLQWVQYEWPANAVINKAELYWFDDNGGVRAPTTAYLEYWNGTAWVRLQDVPLAKDAFNTVDISNINTSKLRVSMKNSLESTGIIEFRVWGYYSLPAADKLTVLHMDPTAAQSTENTIRNYLQVKNESGEAVAYKDITVRYWLTVEEFADMSTQYIDYAQIGTGNVFVRYVPLSTPRSNAYGYVEYRFSPAAGNLNANAVTGPIQSRIAKSDWTNFTKANDYSYAPNTAYVKNERITVYQNLVLVGGKEPGEISGQQSLKVYSKDVSTSANTISHYLTLNNEGNTPVSYGDITLRYWFTADGTSPLNYYIDYAKMGNAWVKGKFVTLTTPLTNADTYLEISFAAPGNLYPLSGTGTIQQRIAKTNWSAFNQLNDHSYKAGNAFGENVKVTAYVKGVLVYGEEPTPLAIPAIANKTTAAAQALEVAITQNPVTGNDVEAVIRGVAGQRLEMVLADAAGKVIATRKVGAAATVEKQRFSVQQVPAQVLFLQVSTGTQTKTVKIVRIR